MRGPQPFEYPKLCHYHEAWLEFECRRCPRKGRYHITRLAEKYGSNIAIKSIAEELAKTCTTRMTDTVGERYCGIITPGLVRLYDFYSEVNRQKR